VFVLVTCFALTVFFDMVIAVSVGSCCAILFMRRMAEITGTTSRWTTPRRRAPSTCRRGVGYYEVNGPLFFGAAQNAMEALQRARGDTFEILVLHLGRVPVIDATGFAALENAIEALMRRQEIGDPRRPSPPSSSASSRRRTSARSTMRCNIVDSVDAAR